MSSDGGYRDPVPALQAALALYGTVRDIVAERPSEEDPARWAEARGWEGFLVGLDDSALQRCEAVGLARAIEELGGAPESLRELCRAVREATSLPLAEPGRGAPWRGSVRRVALAKRAQLDGLLRLCAPAAARATRVVDVGSGHGHVARWMAELFALPTLGWEREPSRVRRAEELARASERARYQVLDLLASPWELEATDLAVGLHACGDLGDATTQAVGRAGCAVVLVGCCAQKILGETRAPLSRVATEADLRLSRSILGLANLSSRARGVAGAIDEVMGARRTRLALRLLLRQRGVSLRAGEELRGVNRRRTYRTLAHAAQAVLTARGLAPPTPAELGWAEQAAAAPFARLRRASLPRNMLGRLLEVLIALDRATLLRESGLEAEVVLAFDEAASQRNVAVRAAAR